ncbi:hypothetical protein IKG31_00365 [Candidatus Saccharibacteria bacterium]|nr:hypothetical protein [Candidatus Saccharibacteria bacterium]
MLLKDEHPELAKYWNHKRNDELGLAFKDVTSGSGKKVWWKCERGHEWQAAPYNVSKGQGCPFCSNRRVLKGFNDLETLNPELAAEWNYTKNGNLKPSDVIAGSTKTVWWKCPKGHEWKARIYSRNKNHSCPICNMYKITSVPEKAIVYYLRKAGFQVEENKKIDGKKEVDIFIPSKSIAIEYDGQYWHEDIDRDIKKNQLCSSLGIMLLRVREPLLPKLNSTSVDFVVDKITSDYSYLKPAIIWVLHYLGVDESDVDIPRDIQEIYDLYNDSTVIESIKTFPGISEKWDYEKNVVNIESVSRWSRMKAWWKCVDCGYSYMRTVSSECNGAKCPKCASTELIVGYNDLATVRQDLLKLWNYEKNGATEPSSITPSSNKKVWWKCPKGHEWETAPHDILDDIHCPYCTKEK